MAYGKVNTHSIVLLLRPKYLHLSRGKSNIGEIKLLQTVKNTVSILMGNILR